MATRWGVAGCGSIANDFVTSWKGLPEGDHVLIAAAARSRDRAQEFVKKFDGQRAYGSYQELADDPEVEVVYVAVINNFHLEVVQLMLKAGKNVLCEKTLGINVKETKTMVELAREKGVFFMEAIWSRCFPVYQEARRRIQEGEIGDVQAVTVSLGFPLNAENIKKKALGGGASFAIGVYCVQLVVFAIDEEMPNSIVANGILSDDGVDESVSISMTFPSGKVASIIYDIRCVLDNTGLIAGSKGTMKLHPFAFAPENLSSPSGEFVSKVPQTAGSMFHLPLSQGLMYEADHVRQCLKNGQLESPLMPLDHTLKIAEILESALKQVGVQY